MQPDTDRWIVIPNWDEFQHYPNRDPIWIKNYRRLTSDDAYRNLTFVQRGILHGLWLEYAASNRQIRDSTLTVTRRLGQRVTRASLDALNHAGFIHFSASKPLAPCYHSRASREEKRRDVDREKGSTRSSISTPLEARPQAAGAYAEELARLVATNGNGSGTHEIDEPYFDRLLTAVGNTEQNFAKLRRAARGQPTAAIIAALEAAHAPTTREPLAVALTVLANYGQESTPSEASG